ncbi:MAG: large conductance mechanosensitive channel protein MscL [Candidatus Aminicenantes bacterium]|nr:large conductance mechanosensitive channel protein MscL [Candidatus Aminicenantes bacterium]
MFKEFKEFAMKGSVLDMAVGIIIGAAFGSVVQSFVADILMPPIGLLLGRVDFANLFLILGGGATPGPYASLAQAQAAGAVTFNYGAFINKVVSLLIVAFALFLVIKSMNRLRKKQGQVAAPAETKECPFCLSAIPLKATRCPHCTSQVQ